jgi:pyruvate/2-oxoglutarate dehydrogenase complex dihydrolipoamide acyltransferase (E2) component
VAVTEGTIVEWFAGDGAVVQAGVPLYRMETEKVEMDVEAPATGVLHITGQPGETYPVGEVIGFIAEA